MTEGQSNASTTRSRRENEDLCKVCKGTGRVLSRSVLARARRGGNVSYLASLDNEQLSMSERGRLGGRPRELSLDQVRSLAATHGNFTLAIGYWLSSTSTIIPGLRNFQAAIGVYRYDSEYEKTVD